MSGRTSNRKKLSRKGLVVCSCVLAIALLLSLLHYFVPFRALLPAYAIPARREGELRIHFLDVGQGDCTVIEYPSGGVLVIDAGDGSWENNNKIVRYLKGLSPSRTELLLTHADSDHYGGFTALLKTFGAEVFYLPSIPSEASAYTELLETVERTGCETAVLTRYATIADESGAYAVCLSPYSFGETDGNEASVVLYLSYEGINAVFCGDVSAEREQRLAREYAIDETLFDSRGYTVRLPETNILKVAHHGSAYSSSEEWVSLLNAEVSVISCGRGNSYSHPTGAALSRLSASEIYRTDELGDIVVCIYQGSYNVYTDFTNIDLEG